MTNLSPFTSPFIAEDTPTMGGILTEIDNITDLSDTRRRDLKSDVRSLCRLLGKHPSKVPRLLASLLGPQKKSPLRGGGLTPPTANATVGWGGGLTSPTGNAPAPTGTW